MQPFGQDLYIRNLANYLFKDTRPIRQDVYGQEKFTPPSKIRHC